MRIAAQNALNSYIGEVGRWIGFRNSEGALILDTRVVDVVARGERVSRTKLVVELADEDVSSKRGVVVADEIVRVRCWYPPGSERASIAMPPVKRDRSDSLEYDFPETAGGRDPAVVKGS